MTKEKIVQFIDEVHVWNDNSSTPVRVSDKLLALWLSGLFADVSKEKDVLEYIDTLGLIKRYEKKT